jgi:hypothetical protein
VTTVEQLTLDDERAPDDDRADVENEPDDRDVWFMALPLDPGGPPDPDEDAGARCRE